MIATSKVPSTLDVTSGVRLVLQQLLDKTEIDGKDLQCITIGTTASFTPDKLRSLLILCSTSLMLLSVEMLLSFEKLE